MSEKTASPPLRVRPMTAQLDDLRRMQACFQAEGTDKAMESLRWQYAENPAGEPLVDFSVDDSGGAEVVAAIYAVFPVQFQVQGRELPGSQSLDTLTMPPYRGRGIFVNLAESVYSRSATGGVGFVYGFPNGNSAPGFFKKLGWQRLDPVPFLIRPLRSRYALARVPRVGKWLARLPDFALPRLRRTRLAAGQALEEVRSFGAEFDALWARAGAELPVAIKRDAAYLNWRMGKPGESYRTFAVREGTALLGFVTCCVKEKHGGRIGYVIELLRDPEHPRVAEALLRHAVAEMTRAGADAALAWCFDHSPTRPAHRAAGFVSLPERIRPIELHFGVRPFSAELAATLERRENWYISYCDSDTV